jgi:N-acetylneuraminate synthase
MLKKFQLSRQDFRELSNFCEEIGIEDLYSVFDVGDVAVLLELGKSKVKIPSGEITNGPLLLEVARRGLDVILSTGMSDLAEVREALSVLAYGYTKPEVPQSRTDFKKILKNISSLDKLRQKVTVLHCVSEYPAPVQEVNLRAMDSLADEFGLPVGFSDHTPGAAIAIAAVARGAKVIEKHFTLDRDLPGPDQQSSLEPQEFKNMVNSIRKVELALGDGEKKCMRSEEKNKKIVRKSLVAAAEIRKGEKLNSENLAVRRPATGISPLEYWNKTGKFVDRSYKENELIM